ncbi:MAG: PEP-CTERM sorting domain-containing protein [Pseudolysinimonas sp.]
MAAVVGCVLLSAPVFASPVTYQVGEFAFYPGDSWTAGYPSLFNLTGCFDPTDPYCLPAALQNTPFTLVSFSDDQGSAPTDFDTVDLSADYFGFAESAQAYFVSLYFQGSNLGSFSVLRGVEAASTPILFTYDDAPQTPVPEPGTLTLLGGGVAAMAIAARRRRRQHPLA